MERGELVGGEITSIRSTWSLVASSTVSAFLIPNLSSLEVVSDFFSNSCKVVFKFSSFNCSVNGFGVVFFSAGTKAALYGAIMDRMAGLISQFEMLSKK